MHVVTNCHICFLSCLRSLRQQSYFDSALNFLIRVYGFIFAIEKVAASERMWPEIAQSVYTLDLFVASDE